MMEYSSDKADQRYDVIDALRGFALTGVCLVNLVSLSLYEFLDAPAKDALASSRFDHVAELAMAWSVNIKFITIFSLLFGMGFSLQMQRASSRGEDGSWRYIRRIFVLMAMGSVHAWFVWWGDILLTYAVVGLMLLPLRNVPDRVLLILGVVIALLPPLISPYVRGVLPDLPAQGAMYEQSLEAFSSGHWKETFSANMAMSEWARVSNWALVCFVLGRFLLGYWAGRKGLLAALDQNLSLLRRIFVGALATGFAATVLSYVQAPMRAAWPIIDIEPVKMLIRVLLRAGPLGIGIAYATGFALLFRLSSWARRLSVLVPLGRMALTNYVTQSLFGIALFYGIGLGVGPDFGMAGILVAWVLILSLQIWWSRAWLTHFTQGPFEWAWRWLTYGRRPKLRNGTGALERAPTS
ncbi:DUF418 domain-containing protein [Lysobacter gummosus]|uniref:DUF418 domain-containing protein n=1 Tax=Lysobacter gummosus TaxID=262324 RepID=A0ABY3X997_9GAMM|nr:DUF418 domain-containing protein [Lysobacter gummosus]ALN93746.1 hypothetical protein LG3211_4812 [Lysobacter gummosus]UNP29174.1 DUF418 domain-containing protein [Lysobacter gummosus]